MLGAIAGGASIYMTDSNAIGEVVEPIKGEWGSSARYAAYRADVERSKTVKE